MTDYTKMTVAELKDECKSRGLAVSGTKAVLIQRLEDDDGGAEEEPAPVAPPPKAAKKSAAAKPAKKAAAASKKRAASEMLEADEEEDDEPAPKAEEKAVAKPPPAKKGRGSAAKVDQYYRGAGKVYEDGSEIWDAMLMQVSISRNNNKYYVLQLLESPGGRYEVFTRWGRVDEPGQNKVIFSGPLAGAKAAFCKKFKDKTKNVWAPGIRDNFKAVGHDDEKYTLMDMADEEECAEPMLVDEEVPKAVAKRVAAKVRASTLAPQLQSLLSLCFSEDTITEQLEAMEIDTKKMPIGRISKAQLEKGRGVLEKIAKAIAGETKGDVNKLTSEFYQFVPHSFGRTRPLPLNTTEKLQAKFDMINTLTDMTVVQDLMAKEKKDAEATGEIDHPLDRQFKDLECSIDVVPRGSPEYDYVSKYFEATKESKLKLLEVFRVDRKGESERYAAHDDLENRKLLWHGTNIAVVVAILKTGLRIMPHSGGRVGRGIYHASENSKSSGYVRTAKKTGIMFINEVALGKSHEIDADDWSITKPPAGFDSVLAQGWTEPDPKQDIVVDIEGRKVAVPQGKVAKRTEWNKSRFSQSEYLVYKESQVRMRYMLRIEFPH
jgi:poly [ADP-ribose] polymerase